MATTRSAPSAAAATARIPLPQPTSSTVAPGRTSRASARETSHGARVRPAAEGAARVDDEDALAGSGRIVVARRPRVADMEARHPQWTGVLLPRVEGRVQRCTASTTSTAADGNRSPTTAAARRVASSSTKPASRTMPGAPSRSADGRRAGAPEDVGDELGLAPGRRRPPEGSRVSPAESSEHPARTAGLARHDLADPCLERRRVPDWVMTQPGPVKSNTKPSPLFSICTIPVVIFRRAYCTVGAKATTCPVSIVMLSPAGSSTVSRAP